MALDGHPLRDEFWHVTDYYNNIQTKLRALDAKEKIGTCHHISGILPDRVCSVPMKARTEYTPRFNPESTSIRSIVKSDDGQVVPQLTETMLYDGPDKANPMLLRPDDAIDVVQIVSNRRRLLSIVEDGKKARGDNTPLSRFRIRRLDGESHDDSINKWNVSGLPGRCDGESESICGRMRSSTCLLSGHVDSVGGLSGDDTSGRIIMTLEQVKEGIIILKLDTHELEVTEDFQFDFSIDGIETSWSKTVFLEKRKSFSGGSVEFFTLLDSADFAKESTKKNVDLGIQVRNCTTPCGIWLTHVYWA